ncbi:MAG: putative UDP-perosamine 4-acetyltransferase [Solimicrobium sp.]|jgi:UDP-perosamine 4-acetyltransferase|nr:putative UDP-perosamine 4-acetyltransferase [Solimicrobium sp.]
MTRSKEDFVSPLIQITESKLTFGNVTLTEPNMKDILNNLMGNRVKVEPDALQEYETTDVDLTEPPTEHLPLNVIEHPSQTEQINVFNINLPFLFSLNSQEFITAAYSLILNRAPDETGQRYYQQRLEAGISRIQILGQLAASGENDTADIWYRELRGPYLRSKWRRIPVIGWICEFIAAITQDHLSELLALNEEQFVVKAFHSILGRAPETGALEHYLAVLRAGQDKMTILIDIKQSKEGKAAGSRVAGLTARSWFHRFEALPVIKKMAEVLGQLCERTVMLFSGHNRTERPSFKKPVIVLGAGGHAKVIIEILRAVGYRVSYCIASPGSPNECMGVPVLQGDEYLVKLRSSGHSLLFPAIGSNAVRERAAAHAVGLGYELINAISPHAIISPSISLGKGIAIMGGVVINAQSTIEDLSIINTGATIDHDCHIGFCAHVAPQCALAGNVIIGPGAFVGIGASIIPQRMIGNHSIVGAGSVVTLDIPSSATAVGIPARILYKDQKI